MATEHETKTAITFLRNGQVETEMTYGQLQRDVNRFSNTLLELGVQEGDRAIVFIPNGISPQW